MSAMRIKQRAPIRNELCDLTGYYENIVEGICAIEEVCEAYGFAVDYEDCMHWDGEAGNRRLRLIPNSEVGGIHTECDNVVACSYYRLRPGRVEFTVYLS